jgi:methylenetetrahydrofolate reductase (NADPH)
MPQGLFQTDRKITDVLGSTSFTLSAEVIPPRNGAEQEKVLAQIQALIGAGAQFLSVTKGAGGSLRGGSLPIAQAIKEQFKRPVIAHFTCRDLTPQDVENQLMDHHYFGVRNILALRGDPPQGAGTEWKARDGSYSYAYQLIEQIRRLNAGEYLDRTGGPDAGPEREKTDFSIGCAVYPEHPHAGECLEFYRRKIEAGAEYSITQMLFDPEAYERFADTAAAAGLTAPILPGTRILKSREQAERTAARFAVSAPRWIRDRLATDSDWKTDPAGAEEQALEAFDELSLRLREAGAPGIHLFVIADTELASLALKRLNS